MTEVCDLCIIGAGYAGINALNAAAKYLPKGARVVVVARQSRWGGQWVDQYDFVRLHQAHPLFTAGEREWSISATKPWSHLATKKEILQHFEDVVEANVSEKELQLVGAHATFAHRCCNERLDAFSAMMLAALFQYEYGGYTVEGGKVQLVVTSLLHKDGGVVPPPVTILADKMIIATGVNVPQKFPISFSASVSAAVHSLCPADILSPRWHAMMKYSADADKPIWIIGSGKTAMDIICTLSQREPGWRSRLRCVAGRGTWFMDREMVDRPVDAVGNLLPVYFLEMCASRSQTFHSVMSKFGSAR